MRRLKVPAFFGFFFCMFLSAPIIYRQALQAQDAAAAGTIEVKVGQGIDSDRDASGKEYAAIVTQTVNAGGVTITQGSRAMVTLMKAADGTASVQLVSINIPSKGLVPASSSSVTVTESPAQKATSRLGSALGARLGGIAQGAATPIATPTASGARVFLTPGSTLRFIFSMGGPTTSVAAAAPPAPAPAPAAQPSPATAAPALSPAVSPPAASAAGAGGAVTAMDICFSNPPPNPSDLNYGKQFLTAVMEVPVNTQGSIPVLEPAFSAYLKSAYNYPSGGITCQPIWSIADAQAVQKKISGDASHFKMVDTGWRYGQPPVTQGQSGFDPLAQGPGGLDLTQHRLTTYFCTLVAAGGTTMTAPPGPISGTAYVTPVFQADWDPAPVNMAFNLYMRDHYVHDLNLADKSPHCSAQSPAMQTMQHQGAGVGKLIGHKIPVDWTYTPDQGAAASAAVAAAAPPPAPNPAAGGWYVSCSTSGGAGVDTYYTGVFRTSHAVKHSPNGANLVVEGQTILDHFYAWLMQQGYNFKPGSSSACDAAPTEAAAMAAHHKRAYEGGGCSTCGKIAETGWKDE